MFSNISVNINNIVTAPKYMIMIIKDKNSTSKVIKRIQEFKNRNINDNKLITGLFANTVKLLKTMPNINNI